MKVRWFSFDPDVWVEREQMASVILLCTTAELIELPGRICICRQYTAASRMPKDHVYCPSIEDKLVRFTSESHRYLLSQKDAGDSRIIYPRIFDWLMKQFS